MKKSSGLGSVCTVENDQVPGGRGHACDSACGRGGAGGQAGRAAGRGMRKRGPSPPPKKRGKKAKIFKWDG